MPRSVLPGRPPAAPALAMLAARRRAAELGDRAGAERVKADRAASLRPDLQRAQNGRPASQEAPVQGAVGQDATGQDGAAQDRAGQGRTDGRLAGQGVPGVRSATDRVADEGIGQRAAGAGRLPGGRADAAHSEAGAAARRSTFGADPRAGAAGAGQTGAPRAPSGDALPPDSAKAGAVASCPAPGDTAAAAAALPPGLSDYLDLLALVERLHRLLLDVIKDEFERLAHPEVNPVQALLLFNIGDQEVTAGELRSRGYYQGSNVSYNLKKLVEAGYMHHQRCAVDRRAVRIRLTPKGHAVRAWVAALFARHAAGLPRDGRLAAGDLSGVTATLRRLERFWTDQIRYIY